MDNPYLTLRYNSKARWLSYWYQISEVIKRNPSSVLVIGKGSGIVEDTIFKLAPEIKITTFDIDENLLPDVVGDVRYLPFRDCEFDCILCCQTLEHIPFEYFEDIIRNFSRIAKDFVVISLPHAGKYTKIEIETPIIWNKWFKKCIIVKTPFTQRSIRSRRHFWEIKRCVSYRKVENILKKYFIIEKTFLNEINCSHRFFVLKKR